MKNDIATFERYVDPEQLQAAFMEADPEHVFGNQIANNATRHVLKRLIEAGASLETMKWELARAETVRAVLTDVALVRGIGVLLLPDDKQLESIPKA